MENQHRLIKGYADLAQAEIDVINDIKDRLADFADLWYDTKDTFDVDMRWMNIAKTHLEEGASAFVKAVAQGESPFNR